MDSSSDLEIVWLRLLAEQRLRESAKRITKMQRRAEDRDDLAGVNLLLRMLSLMVSQTESLIQGSLREAESSHARGRGRDLDTVRTAIVQLERALSEACSTLISPPERDLTALIQPYVRLAKSLTGETGTELIFESRESFEYEVWADVFEQIRECVEIVAPSLELPIDDLPPFALISYPSRADSETLLHAVIAHEVIHLALVRRREEGENQVSEVFIEKVRERVGDRTTVSTSQQDRVSKLENWLNECLADSLALRIIGPAYFFALVEYFLPTHVSGFASGAADESHPSPTWRLDRLRASAAEFFVDRRGARRPAADTFDRFLKLMPAVPEDQDAATLEDQQLLEEMVAEIDLDLLVGEATYPIDRFRRDVPLVWTKLAQDIAPVERVKGRRVPGKVAEDKAPRFDGDTEEGLQETDWSQTVDWRSILNGGYLHYLHRSLLGREASDPVQLAQIREEVNSMVRGSIELSELHRRMIELQGEFAALNPVDVEP